MQNAIIVEDIGKKFLIGSKAHGTLRHTLQSLFQRGQSEEFWALKNVSFELKHGQALGIVGNNGAGKSTLLKILSRIMFPTSGRAEVNGRLTSLLEIGTGFHPELTGRENIFLNGSLLGMSNAEIRARFDEILDFSGVEKFVDTPVKHFSSGMYTRLAFSVAAHLNTEILVVDEVLAVGDQEFQKKCLGKMGGLTDQGKTVLLVSHNYTYLEKLCDQFILLENGTIKTSATTLSGLNIDDHSRMEVCSSKVGIISEIQVIPCGTNRLVKSGNDVKIVVKTLPFQALQSQIMRIEIVDGLGGVMLVINNRLTDDVLDLRSGCETEILVQSLPLNQGSYGINLVLKDRAKIIDQLTTVYRFSVHASDEVKLTNAKAQAFAKYSYTIKQ